MSTTVSVQLEELASLGACLAALGGQADDEADLCRSTGGALDAALGEDEAGRRLGAVAATWGGLAGLLAQQSRALATTVLAAADSYRDTDDILGRRVAAAGAPHGAPLPR